MFKQIILKIALLIKILLVFALIGAGVYIWWKLTQQPKLGQQTSINTSAVIKELQELNRLETASFTVEKIVDTGTTSDGIKEFLFGDRLLLIAHGTVIAGIDFSKIESTDISIIEKKLTIKLPPAEIFINSLDESKTHVYDRQTGILTKANKGLESQARENAQESIRRAACEGNILQMANESAAKQIKTLMLNVGFIDVMVVTSQGDCSY